MVNEVSLFTFHFYIRTCPLSTQKDCGESKFPEVINHTDIMFTEISKLNGGLCG